jgi:hypothetical protein
VRKTEVLVILKEEEAHCGTLTYMEATASFLAEDAHVALHRCLRQKVSEWPRQSCSS